MIVVSAGDSPRNLCRNNRVEREGDAKSWFPDGGQQTDESWLNGRLTRRREWDDKGALKADDEFEEDGSRKMKR